MHFPKEFWIIFKEEEVTAGTQHLLRFMKYPYPKGSDVHRALPVN